MFPEPEENPPDAPTEPVAEVDSIPPAEPEPPASPVVSAQGQADAKPTRATRFGSGDSQPGTYGVGQLDNSDFKPFGNLKPTYPAVARKLGVQGRATVRVLVNPKGRVDSVQIVEWKGHPAFGDNAAQSARQWRFAPPRYKGQPARAW